MSRLTTRNRQEDDRAFVVTKDVIAASTPQDKTACAMATALLGAGGMGQVEIAYDLTSGDVFAVWQEPEGDRLRNYQGIVEPHKQAMQILMGTDLDIRRLAQLCPPEGWEMRITRCDSRYQQPGQRGMPRPNRTGTRGTSLNRRPRRISARAARVS